MIAAPSIGQLRVRASLEAPTDAPDGAGGFTGPAKASISAAMSDSSDWSVFGAGGGPEAAAWGAPP